MCEVVHVRSDSAQDAKDRLNEERGLGESLLHDVGEIVEVTHVVALELKARTTFFAQTLQGGLDLGKGVDEDAGARPQDIGLLPVVLPLALALCGPGKVEVDRAHVERGDLGLEHDGGLESLLNTHGHRATCRDVDNGVGVVGQGPDKRTIDLGVGRRSTVPGVPGVQVQDRCPGFHCTLALGDHLFGSNWQPR